MTTAILAFLFMLSLVGAMAIGVIMGRAPISGSCGGMKALGMDVECEICGGNPALCDSSEGIAESSSADQGNTAGKDATDLSTRIGR